ncbi:GNAT family N-acetyltransferase [Levilactobacillus parabrevis]|uniref:N-acetyltransferase GCN5 n=1 Tax=Levilactobacillus parabrevis ATCC 53295 TaxID=1267003 RepID=A0A0R1GRV6_9LACO|nr:GNAT family N-acetyltransferase [Levilactobacillus parabrevis]KRK36757.1 N-acetyltransferase GCN5 [Levilactobacillus parabrevis ATCC 53295]KRO05998.1 N-acetyltransferase GCN5 [Levilactobacillus parabrevis]
MSAFQQKSFEQLTTTELFEIYRVRVAVFVVEQTCAYQEVDDLDVQAQHLFTQDATGAITAYARLMDEGQQVRIGRVLVAPTNRGNGAGRQLVSTAIAAAQRTYPAAQAIVIQAQAYLQKFYASFGFQPTIAVYLDTGIPHIDMVLPLT